MQKIYESYLDTMPSESKISLVFEEVSKRAKCCSSEQSSIWLCVNFNPSSGNDVMKFLLLMKSVVPLLETLTVHSLRLLEIPLIGFSLLFALGTTFLMFIIWCGHPILLPGVLRTPIDEPIEVDVNKIIELDEPPKDLEQDNVPYISIEEAPVFKGCEGLSKSENKKCFDKQMNKFIQHNFNT